MQPIDFKRTTLSVVDREAHPKFHYFQWVRDQFGKPKSDSLPFGVSVVVLGENTRATFLLAFLAIRALWAALVYLSTSFNVV
jgi:hypothetical protein